MDARSKRARPWIEALPDDAWLASNRDRLRSYWSEGVAAIARNGGAPSLADMEDYAASLGRAVGGGEEIILGQAIATGRVFFQLDDDEMTPFLRRCIRSMVEAGARPAILSDPASGAGALTFIRLATEAPTSDAVADAILARRLEDKAGSTPHIFAKPERFPLGWSELSPPPDVDPSRAADAATQAHAWVAERAAVAMADDVSLLSLIQAGRSRFGLAGSALEAFVGDCIRAMLNAGAMPLKPAGEAEVSMQPAEIADGGVEEAVTTALSLLRDRGEDPSLAVDLCFGWPAAIDAGPDTRRPGSETVLTTTAAFEMLVATFASTAPLKEAPPGYPGAWFHSPDGSITGYARRARLGSLLEVLRPSRDGRPMRLPLVIQSPRQTSSGDIVWPDDMRTGRDGERTAPPDE